MLRGKRGFTLLEILIVMAITAMMLPVVGAAFYMLLTVPAKETGKLTTLNDVNLALNWIHQDVNRGQFFAGDPGMLRSIFSIDFTQLAGSEQQAWQKLVSEPTSPTDRPTVCSNYSLINASDSYRWNTSLGSSYNNNDLETQMFKFTVNNSLVPDLSEIESIVISWQGYGESDVGHATEIKIWGNPNGTWQWVRLGESAFKYGMGTEGWLSGRRTFNATSTIANYSIGREIYVLAETSKYKAASCPHIYGWDGDTYRLIDVAITASFMKRYESVTYDSTTMLQPKDGYYDLMAAAQWPHDEYINSLGLWAVEHPEGTTVIADGLGNVHTLSNPQPVTAVDSYGRDVTGLLSAAGDGALWESDLKGKDLSDISQLHDWIEITLPDRPEDGSIAKLVVDVASTTLSDTELDGFLHYILGSPNLGYVLDRIQNNPTDMQWFDYNLWLTAALRIQSWNGTDWADLEDNPGILDMSGYLGRPQVVPIDLSRIQGDRIRLLTPAGMHQFDYVAVDYTPDEAVSVIELKPVGATLHKTTDANVSVTQDVLSQVAATDDAYACLEQGDYINYRFEALDDPAEGTERSFIVLVGGYYYRVGPVEPQDKMENLGLWEHMLYTPYAASQHFLPIYVDPESYPDFQAFHSSKKFIQPEFLATKTANSLLTNYIKLVLLRPGVTYNMSTTNTTTYGGFYWIDKTDINNSISYTTHYYWFNTSSKHQLIREEWQDNELVSTVALAFNIQHWDDITFDYYPAGTTSAGDILPYLVVDITASTSEGTYYTAARGRSHIALRSTTLSQGVAVLTTEPVNTVNDSVLLSGNKLIVDGNLRCYGNITITGSNNLVTGKAEYAGSILGEEGALVNPQPLYAGATGWDLDMNDFVDDYTAPASNEYIWYGNVNLDTESDIWDDPPTNTVLKPGVYRAVNGNLSLGKANVSGMVTLIGDRKVTVTSRNSSLSPFCNGVLLFGNGSYNDSVTFSGDGGAWSGSLFAPEGGVTINGTRTQPFYLFGSIAAKRFYYSANSQQEFRIKF